MKEPSIQVESRRERDELVCSLSIIDLTVEEQLQIVQLYVEIVLARRAAQVAALEEDHKA
jgi:hypothetical protein